MVQFGERGVQGRVWNADGAGPYTVERLPEFQRRLGPTLGHRLHDRPYLGQHALRVGTTARQGGPQPRGRQLRAAQVDAGHQGSRAHLDLTSTIVPEQLKWLSVQV